MDYVALKNEITTDPLVLGYAGKSDMAIAGILNTSNAAYTANNPLVPLTTLSIWAAKNSVRGLIEQNALNNASAVQSICLAVKDLLQGVAGTWDSSNPDNKTMVQALVTAGVMTVAQQTSVLALGNKSPASRAEVLFGPGTVVDAYDVRTALGRAS